MTTATSHPMPETKRDYSLVGASTRSAIESGLTSADWYQTPVSRQVLKELMKRSDAPAIRDTIIWLGVMAAALAGGVWFWGTWWCVPFFFVYGTLYGSASDSRWHECGHGTAFKTRWMNDVVYEIASFMLMRNPVTWRWSHARHHTDTIIVGRDAEIAIMRPPDLLRVVLNFVGIVDVWRSLSTPRAQRGGDLSRRRKELHSGSGERKAVFAARVHVAIYVATVAAALHHEIVAAADAHRAAAHVRLLAHGDGRAAAARRPRRQCRRPSAEHAHRLHEPDQPVHLLEHELSHRAPHVPDGAVPRDAAAA